MNRKEYMKELAFLLSDISDDERAEALNFYENYFDEAGIDHESQVIQELGEPSRIAAMIKADLKGDFDEHIEVGNQGFTNDDFNYRYEVKDVKTKGEKTEKASSWKQKWHAMESRDKLILAIILVLCVVPLSFPILGMFTGLFAVGFGLALPLFIFFFGFWIVTFVLYVIAIAMIVGGVIQMFSLPGAGFICLGVGCLFLGLAQIFNKIASWFFKTCIPAIIDGIASIFNKLFDRGNSYENKV